MTEKILCEKCGAEMKPADTEKPVGMTCPNCGWGWATTFIEPVSEDTADYTVFLLGEQTLTSEKLKTVAEITGTNYLQAKKLIGNAPAKVFVGKADAVKTVLKALSAAEICYHVEPQFPYSFET